MHCVSVIAHFTRFNALFIAACKFTFNLKCMGRGIF